MSELAQDRKIWLYDATLREGAQSAGAAFSVLDKLHIVEILDELGIPYIEAGNPGSNAKDAQLYERLKERKLKNSKIVAFGATCRPGLKPEEDLNMQALLAAESEAVAIFGKSWDYHVDIVLRCSLEENLNIIKRSIRFLKEQSKEVVYDAEHFFDGCKNNLSYAISTIQAAEEAGADWICLCDTNGGITMEELELYFQKAKDSVKTPLGIHAHNDSGLALANSLKAVRLGADMAQCTLGGLGERCGNADLFTVLCDLQLKYGYDCIEPEKLKTLAPMAAKLNELMNRRPNRAAPYVGSSAFAHKAGMHVDAVLKASNTFEHIDPALLGAERRILVSEVAGKSAVLEKIASAFPELNKNSPEMQKIVDALKARELAGYQYEGAEASFELMVRRVLKEYKSFFKCLDYKVVIANAIEEDHSATAMIRVEVGGEEEITAADGNGPVNALDKSMRKALELFYPSLKKMHLSDFKVRVLDSKHTESMVRVLIESSDEHSSWTTVGVNHDVVRASFEALTDSIEYKLLQDIQSDREENI